MNHVRLIQYGASGNKLTETHMTNIAAAVEAGYKSYRDFLVCEPAGSVKLSSYWTGRQSDYKRADFKDYPFHAGRLDRENGFNTKPTHNCERCTANCSAKGRPMTTRCDRFEPL